MARSTINADLYLLVDAAGDYAVGRTKEEAIDAYENHIQPLADADGWRLIKMDVTVPLPELVELSIDIPATDDEPTVSVG